MAVTPERRLKKVVIDIMRNPLFADMSGIMMLGKKSVVDDIPTACTDGRDELYGRAFIDSLSDKELAFVVLHEAMHKALRQLTMWHKLFKEDAMLCNMAADYVVNLMLVKRDPNGTVLSMPMRDGKPMGLLDRKYDGMNTKQVFDLLKEDKKNGSGVFAPGAGDGTDGKLDDHNWEGAQELSQEEKNKLAKEIDQALRQGQMAAQKMHGKGAGNMDRELTDLLDPKIDWRELLREFISSTCAARDTASWRRPNRRFVSMDTYLPSLIGERVNCVAIGCDTSGSISVADHARNLTETDSMLSSVHPEKLHLIYWDHSVAGHEEYDDSNRDSFRTSTKPRGGGGTDPTCMMRHLKENNIKPDCIIMFTDGEIGDWGNEWDAPILWCIVNKYRGKSIMAPVGKTIHVED